MLVDLVWEDALFQLLFVGNHESQNCKRNNLFDEGYGKPTIMIAFEYKESTYYPLILPKDILVHELLMPFHECSFSFFPIVFCFLFPESSQLISQCCSGNEATVIDDSMKHFARNINKTHYVDKAIVKPNLRYKLL